MKRFNLLLTLLIALIISACAPKRAAVIASDIKDIVILYDNDVHCAVDGYPAIAALKKQLKAENNYVSTVSSGDFVQGGSLGAVSKGEYIVRLLNAADYDFVALGNHEFDYGLQRLDELSKMISAQILCCNLSSLKSGRMLYPAYSIIDYGGRKVGFIGVSTPYSFASSTPAHFKDSDGNWLYSLHSDMTYEIVQQNIDEVRAKGADYVVLLTHLGIDAETDPINSLELIKHVSGMDVVLDGHSHVTISSQKLKDKNGKEVVLTSTGSHFENIGKLQIKADGTISTELIKTGTAIRDKGVEAIVAEIRDEYKTIGQRLVGRSEERLNAKYDNGDWIVRAHEGGIGDFCADALQKVMNVDIGIIGGGSIRNSLPKGNITFNDIYSVMPFENTIAVAKMKGSQIIDMLELSASALPDDFGGFLQVAGLTFDIDISHPSPVVFNSDKIFLYIDNNEPRRVSNIKVVSAEGTSAQIEPEKIYSVAASSYLLIDHGDGYEVVAGATVTDSGTLDSQVMEQYIKNLGGTIPAHYATSKERIRIKRE